MSRSSLDSLKIRAKLFQKLKKKAGSNIPLKNALQIIAKNSGYKNWRELKTSFDQSELFNPRVWSAQWKTWFASREEALIHFDHQNDFLLPYRNQFFICDFHYINSLGIEINDPDLELVGRDWSSPKNAKAFICLQQKIRTHLKALKAI